MSTWQGISDPLKSINSQVHTYIQKCRRSPTVNVNGFSSIYLTVGAVCKRVRAPQTSSGIDCTQAKALVQGDCYKDLGNKADIIGRLITTWKAACGASPEPCATAIDATVNQPAFNEIRSRTLSGYKYIFVLLAQFLPSFCPHAIDCRHSNSSFLILEDGWDEIDIIRVLRGLPLTKFTLQRRSDGLGSHFARETARIDAFRLSSLTGRYRNQDLTLPWND